RYPRLRYRTPYPDRSMERRNQNDQDSSRKKRSMKPLFLFLLACHLVVALDGHAQPADSTDLTIIVADKTTGQPLPAWITIASRDDANIGGWYRRRGSRGFPSFSPFQITVPSGTLTISAWNHQSVEVETT